MFEGRSVLFDLDAPDDHIQRFIATHKRLYEDDLCRFLYHAGLPGMTLLDIGANIGNHTLLWSGIVGNRTIAVECEPGNLRRLARNIELNGIEDKVRILPVAAFRRSAEGNVVVDNPANSGKARVEIAAGGTVALRAMDDVVDEPVHVIKVDVEGLEVDVLMGARQLIERHRPLIVVEGSTADDYAAIRDLLAASDYAAAKRFCWTPSYLFVDTRPRSDWMRVIAS